VTVYNDQSKIWPRRVHYGCGLARQIWPWLANEDKHKIPKVPKFVKIEVFRRLFTSPLFYLPISLSYYFRPSYTDGVKFGVEELTEQGMGHSEWPMTQVTHWALDPWPMWPMSHWGRHVILAQALHRFIDYPALYLDTVYVHTPISCYIIAHVSKLHTQAPVNLEFAKWKLNHCIA